jgi:hypothetical protein
MMTLPQPVQLPYFKLTALAMTEYNDGNPCLLGRFEFGDGETEDCALSVNAPDALRTLPRPEPEFHDGKHVFIKSYSERQGMIEALVDAGIVKVKTEAPSGFVSLPWVEILIDIT